MSVVFFYMHGVIVLKNRASVIYLFLNITLVLVWFSYFALARVRQVDRRSVKLNPTSGNVHGTISQLQQTRERPRQCVSQVWRDGCHGLDRVPPPRTVQS